jgi:phospholipase/carboxylesterase
LNTSSQNEPGSIQFNGWKLRERPPQATTSPRVLLLLHGWTGDEKVMWIFVRRFPVDYWMLAPRAPYQAGTDGYSWHARQAGLRATLDDFRPAMTQLLDLVDSFSRLHHIDASRFSLMGFSQGAAMALCFGLSYPQRVDRIACLAGYLPQGCQTLLDDRPLAGKQVYVAHGTQDDRVPIAYARSTVEQLDLSGARVTYCESEVGHKLSADCLHGLEAFFA